MVENSHIFLKRSLLPCNVTTLFEHHTQKGVLERLTPAWSGLNLISQTGGINNDAITIFRINFGPVGLKLISKHYDYVYNKQFQDEMIKGPFKKWIHTHSFIQQRENQSIMEDKIEYIPKFDRLTSKVFSKKIENYLNQLFIYRHKILLEDIHLKNSIVDKGKKILITGSHGLIGQALIPLLTSVGEHQITRLVRIPGNKPHFSSETGGEIIYGNLESKQINTPDLEGFDIVIHLAGENIFGRWTEAKKERILNSRVKSTAFLSESLSNLKNPPSVLICASAIGYYGNRPGEILAEEARPGHTFLSKVCQQWENATKDAEMAGIRVVNTRFGVILSPKAGMLQKLLIPFKLGLGIAIGNKDQYINWVSIEDVIKSIFYSITQDSIKGPVNIVSPNAVTIIEFSNTLKKILDAKLSVSIRSSVIKIILGQMGDELLSTDSHIIPKKLLENGYRFSNPELEDTLRFLLGKMH